MMRRPVFVLLLLIPSLSVTDSTAQTAGEQQPAPPIIESPAPIPEVPEQELLPQEDQTQEPQDAVAAVGELRRVVRTSPQNADERLRLAQALHRLGDLEAAIEECRVAIKLRPDDAKAHLQLGVMLMAKQDWRASSSVLKEAIRLDPGLSHAHYSHGIVQYSLGNVKAAIQSYREALELQPYFPDARYRLAVLLKLSGQDREAAQLMEEAAIGGVPQARLFLGNAYKNGQGVEKNLMLAIFWWVKAAELGQQAATDALSKLRRQALSSDNEQRRFELQRAFEAYRAKLWDDFPDYDRTGDNESVGVLLRKDNRADSAVPVLLQECYALGELAQSALATLYEACWDQYLPPFDKRILACFETTATDGFSPAKKILARIYAKGLGLEADPKKAKAVLKGLSKQDMKSTLDQLGIS